MTEVGIDDIAIHFPKLYFDMEDFAKFRGHIRIYELYLRRKLGLEPHQPCTVEPNGKNLLEN